jgi:hypothetical protein
VVVVATGGDPEVAVIQNNNAVSVERFGLLKGQEAQDRLAVGTARREPSSASLDSVPEP